MDKNKAIELLEYAKNFEPFDTHNACRIALDFAIDFMNNNEDRTLAHTKWSWYPDDIDRQELLCTNCGKECPRYEYVYERSKWCPHCGAKMDLE